MRCDWYDHIFEAVEIFDRQLYEVVIEKVIEFPDPILIISSMATREMLIEALKYQRHADLHVMYETLQEEHLYTGVRTRPKLSEENEDDENVTCKKCSICEETSSCGNYNEDHRWECEECGEADE